MAWARLGLAHAWLGLDLDWLMLGSARFGSRSSSNRLGSTQLEGRAARLTRLGSVGLPQLGSPHSAQDQLEKRLSSAQRLPAHGSARTGRRRLVHGRTYQICMQEATNSDQETRRPERGAEIRSVH